MNCEEAKPLIEGYFDGELDLVRNLEMEHHVESCPGCAQHLRGRQGLRTLLKSADLSYHAPASLRHWRPETDLRRPESSGRLWAWDFRAWIPAVSMAMVFSVIYIGSSGLTRWSAERALSQEVASAHVRSLMASHLTDVVSTDQHTVKPWFNGRLDFSPLVRDYSDRGYPLIGGRLDYLDSRPVAAIVYRRAAHPINLFVWPTHIAGSKERAFVRQGYNIIHWNSGGMSFWAVSDLNSRELQDFAQIIQS